MNIYDHLDENLSDDLVDENVVASPIKTSSKLIKNMSSTPFDKKPRAVLLMKAPSCPISNADVFSRSSKNISQLYKVDIHAKIPCKEEFRTERRLKGKIEELLQKSSQSPHFSDHSPDKQISAKGLNVEPNSFSSSLNKLITMGDVCAP
ncbi:unnamed protein product [Moneuplotes crassus]|uniref:Uncharacterized protein n=1 Tax=Euplotes crassus TaxID=5936 RepID=A0AAD1U856_EUPCR|nr:unnamed protein product [Moneuplotes crassus]